MQTEFHLGIVFSRTDPEVGWFSDSIKQIHFFTDNPFHYYGDNTTYGFEGGNEPPLEIWSTQPWDLYQYYDRTTVSAFTMGCEWTDKCGSTFESDWAIDQMFFNLVECGVECEQLFYDTFEVMPTLLQNWTPETGIINTCECPFTVKFCRIVQ